MLYIWVLYIRTLTVCANRLNLERWHIKCLKPLYALLFPHSSNHILYIYEYYIYMYINHIAVKRFQRFSKIELLLNLKYNKNVLAIHIHVLWVCVCIYIYIYICMYIYVYIYIYMYMYIYIYTYKHTIYIFIIYNIIIYSIFFLYFLKSWNQSRGC